MPRPPRLLLSKSYYHVMTRGNNRHHVFHHPDDYRCYLRLFFKYKALHPFDLFHYCLMPNHTHCLVRTVDAAEFAAFMKKLNLAYVHYYARRYGWIGHFWQDRYKSQAVGKDAYFLQCGKYIELNPVRANLVQDPAAYPYSSYHYYASGQSDPLITEDIFYSELGPTPILRQQRYRQLAIDEIVTTSYRRPVWGSPMQRYQEQRKIRYHLGVRSGK